MSDNTRSNIRAVIAVLTILAGFAFNAGLQYQRINDLESQFTSIQISESQQASSLQTIQMDVAMLKAKVK